MDTVKIKSDGVRIIAHRGLSGLERENTCSAFVAAGNRSYYGIESDVHITKDGKFVIIHDDTTERITLGKYNINVEENNYSDIEKIILPDLNHTNDRKDLKIPLLSEYISICQKYGKVCVIEVKNHFEEQNLRKMIREIYGTGYLNNVIFISFDFENCVNIRELLPENEVQWLIKNQKIDLDLINELSENNLDANIYYKKLNEEIIKLMHSREIKVNCWTCDDKIEAERLIAYGVDFITTNILE